jgi:hypothetical protein
MVLRAGRHKAKSLVILVGVLIVVGAIGVLSFMNRGNSGKKSSNERVSEAEFAQVTNGWTKDQLRRLAGGPVLIRSQRIGGVRMECWFYNGLPSSGDNPYQFCFSKGILARKYVVNHGSAV